MSHPIGPSPELLVPFFSSMVSHDWERLGYPSHAAATYWDTRSCGVACLRMAYGRLTPGHTLLPATITEELLRLGGYTETHGWNHGGLARHARRYGLVAQVVTLSRRDDF
ncbi:hypothetical protein [Paenarthrobacter sp. NPDC018779]|uniref:hypothetical protein n=1 Tax=Paenarthrobacter sp. NPDC018779 TaxID=3364375 RepID=UPI0037C778B7